MFPVLKTTQAGMGCGGENRFWNATGREREGDQTPRPPRESREILAGLSYNRWATESIPSSDSSFSEGRRQRGGRVRVRFGRKADSTLRHRASQENEQGK